MIGETTGRNSSNVSRATTVYVYIRKRPAAGRRNIILPADRAETHLDVYFYFISPAAFPVRRRRAVPGYGAREGLKRRARNTPRLFRERWPDARSLKKETTKKYRRRFARIDRGVIRRSRREKRINGVFSPSFSAVFNPNVNG